MIARTLPTLLAATAVMLTIGCGTQAGQAVVAERSDRAATTSVSDGPLHPPPAQVLDAELVYFDDDGADGGITRPAISTITDTAELDAFARRFVDGEPMLGTAAAEALADGHVLIGGRVSVGCFAAESARLVLVADGVRLMPVGLPQEDPDLACVRAIISVALVAIDPAELPDAPVLDD